MTDPALIAAFRRARTERINGLWLRYRRVSNVVDGEAFSERMKANLMMWAIRNGLDPHLLVRTGLEAGDLGLEDFDPARAPPTDIRPGPGKVDLLAARVAAGVELFVDGDFAGRVQ